jgi:hypothetical protein
VARTGSSTGAAAESRVTPEVPAGLDAGGMWTPGVSLTEIRL